jgi:hypothetical protein
MFEDRSQEQREQAEGEHGEVPCAGPVIRWGLVRVTYRTDHGLVLRCMLTVAEALRRVADQVQSAEDPVAEEKRADEQYG